MIDKDDMAEIARRAGVSLADHTYNVIRDIHRQHYSHLLGDRPGSCPVCEIALILSGRHIT